MMIGSYWSLLKKGFDFFCYFNKKCGLHTVVLIQPFESEKLTRLAKSKDYLVKKRQGSEGLLKT
jgi:hypothetical protein